jgi:outer membrane protein TolC
MSFRNIAFVVAVGVFTVGCTVSPKPLTQEQLRAAGTERFSSLTANQEEVSQPISLYEAMARAIKYNLDYKVSIYEQALRGSEASLANMDMLPNLVLSASASDRDNYSGSRSSALLGENEVGDVSLVPSTSSDRDVVTSDLELSWDVLDFGLSYVRAKQAGDAALIANERKRKIASRIIEDVRTAYWRAVSADRLIGKLTSLEEEISVALTAADESYRQRNTAPLPALTYQRELLDIQRNIQTMHNELFVAKRQLAALMNLAPSTKFSLVMPARNIRVSVLNFDADKLVGAALVNRPELRELSYEKRISQNEATSALFQLLPNLKLFGGFNYNSNDFLFNNNWTAWGAQASWNIFNVFRYPVHRRTNQLEQQLLEQRALALTMAVVTQVHVSASRYEILKRKLGTMRQYYTVNNNILEQTASGYKARKVSFQNFVREKMNSIVAEAEYDVAEADLQNAYANIYASIGQDTFGNIDTSKASVAELAQHLESHWRKLSRHFLARK